MKVCTIALTTFSLLALVPQPLLAQQPAQNLLRNGDFERFTDEDNLWDGVDQNGLLAGDVVGEDATVKPGAPRPAGLFYLPSGRRLCNIDAILDGGNLGRMPMPISVQVADLNKDGLLDLMTVDGSGYFRVYFNSGTKTEPKFTHCELVPLFLGRYAWPRPPGNSPWDSPWYHRFSDGTKIALGDFTRTGTLDLMMGNYYGNLLFIKNTGTPQAPEWRQPGGIDGIKLNTTKDGQLWANLLAPAAYDWNKDNKMDVIVGEGSYSANAVHLLNNVAGSNSGFSTSGPLMPSFNEDNREYLAFGDGREQLTPAVVDYNGDGIPDLIVGDRSGEINVYLCEGAWKPGTGMELKRQPKPISFGGITSIGQGPAMMRTVSPAVADLNGDGKFDIIVGKPDGHIAVSYNIGTATEPKFGPLVDLKGEKVYPKGTQRSIPEWWISFGVLQGNFLGNYTAVTPQEDFEANGATGKHVLKVSYSPAQNKIIKRVPLNLPIEKEVPLKADAGFSADGVSMWKWGEFYNRASRCAETNTFILRQEPGFNILRPNARYSVSFRVKGKNIRNAQMTLAMGGWLLRDVEAAKAQPTSKDLHTAEALQEDFDFTVGASWSSVSHVVSFKFTQPDLNQFDKWNKEGSKIQYASILDIRATLTSEDSVLYIDNVKITPM